MNSGRQPSWGSPAVYFVFGLITGIALTGFLVVFSLPRMMVITQTSQLSFEETVAQIEKRALESGWKVLKIYDLQESLRTSEQGDIGRMQILSLCRPQSAYAILKEDRRKYISALMPCRLAVYESGQGQAFISAVNLGLLSKIFGGVIENEMQVAVTEQNRILEGIVSRR